MATEKRPIHEILGDQLIGASTVGLRNNGPLMSVGVIMCILDCLRNGKMKAADAHQLAERLAEVPHHMRQERQPDLAAMTEEVLADLRGREDEKKQESSSSPIAPALAAAPATQTT